MNKRLLLSGLALLSASGLFLAACQQEPNPAPEPSGNAGHFETKTDKFQVSVDVNEPPLETQAETYTVKVQDMVGQPAESAQFEVIMPMEGGPAMKAPTQVEKLADPGTYQLQSEFTMPGKWTLEVKPTASSEVVPVPLEVQ
jgi:hypothetical protein